MKKQTKRRIRISGGVLFALYIAALIYLLFFADSYGRTADYMLRYNLVPLREIRRFLDNPGTLGIRAVFLNVYGNILGFIPFGAILPVLHRALRHWYRILFLAAAFSACVELTQLLTGRGIFDIDDIILNTLGGAAGYIIFVICNALRKRHSRYS